MKKFRKRDILIFGAAIVAVLVVVLGVSAAVEHLPANRRHTNDIVTTPQVTSAPATEPVPETTPVPATTEPVTETTPPTTTEPVTTTEATTTTVPTTVATTPATTTVTTAATTVTTTEAAKELTLSEDVKPENATEEPETESISDEDYAANGYNKNIKNIVLIGVDKRNLAVSDYYRMGGQSDFILIVSFNLKTKEYFMVSVNRDLAVPVENYDQIGNSYGFVTEQIALSYAYGDGGRSSGRNVMKSLNAVLGDDIQFLGYIAAPMAIIGTATDLVGGVEVLVEDDFTGVDETLIQGQKVLLKGFHAENFVRARMNMKESNKNSLRMGRQITFMEAFIKKVKNTMSANEVVNLYTEVMKLTKSDMGKSDITKWILNCYDYEFKGIYRLDGTEGERIGGARATYADRDDIYEIAKLYYK